MSEQRTTAQHLVLLAVRGGATRAADIKSGKLKAAERTAAIAELCERGLLQASVKGRTMTLSLTPAGEAACAALPPPEEKAAQARRPGASAPALADLLAALEARLMARLDRLEARLDQVSVRPERSEAQSKGPPSSAADLKSVILEALLSLDRRHRHGGLVPIPALRRELRARGVPSPDADVNAALESLEREYAVDLHVAQSPTTVPERDQGIERPGRGLAYYVAPRMQ